MRQAGLAFLLRQFFYRADRVGHQLVQRQGIVRDTVDERGIGAVFSRRRTRYASSVSWVPTGA